MNRQSKSVANNRRGDDNSEKATKLRIHDPWQPVPKSGNVPYWAGWNK